MNRSEKFEHLAGVIKGCIVKIRQKSMYAKYEWKVGDVGSENRVNNVCKTCFRLAYGVSSSHFDEVVQRIKGKTAASNDVALNDRTSHASSKTFHKHIRNIAKQFGIKLTVDQIAAAAIPNSPAATTCFGWMSSFFKIVGDYVPNKGGEIHLEPTTIMEIHAEYAADMVRSGLDPVSPELFAHIWHMCLPHVRIREKKSVSSTCHTCFKLSALRRTVHSRKDREYITAMHALHRTMYMGERLCYANRKQNAISNPSQYFSAISDGMAQHHTQLPHFGGGNSWSTTMPQHIQGVLAHGRSLTMFRTFHNINNCANVAIHSFLCILENTIKAEGKLPDTVYWQIDGGSENTAHAWFVLCELLIARRLCKRIELTRLKTGHTHEDIDAIFGVASRKLSRAHVLTPQSYKRYLVKAFRKKYVKFKVIDLYAIPNYKEFLDGYLDESFKSCAKGDGTQLQWIFEAVDPDDVYFKHGCRVFYRAYAADTAVEIYTDLNKHCGITAKAVDVFNFPMKDPENGVMVDGMCVMKSLPKEMPQPMKFNANCDEVLSEVYRKAQQEFGGSSPKVLKEWDEWIEMVPQTDRVEDWLEKHPLHIPLGNILFANKPMDLTPVEPVENIESVVAQLDRIRATDCVKWSRWGFKRPDESVEKFARVGHALLNGVQVEVNAIPAQPRIIRKWAKRRKRAADEVGDFSFVLGRKNPSDIDLLREGQFIRLVDGNTRIYWKHAKKAEIFNNADPSTSFDAALSEGRLKLGVLPLHFRSLTDIGNVVVESSNNTTQPLPRVCDENENANANKEKTHWGVIPHDVDETVLLSDDDMSDDGGFDIAERLKFGTHDDDEYKYCGSPVSVEPRERILRSAAACSNMKSRSRLCFDSDDSDEDDKLNSSPCAASSNTNSRNAGIEPPSIVRSRSNILNESDSEDSLFGSDDDMGELSRKRKRLTIFSSDDETIDSRCDRAPHSIIGADGTTWIVAIGDMNVMAGSSNLRSFIGNTFSVNLDHRTKLSFADKWPHGKIENVVCKAAATSKKYFRFYNHVTHPAGPPSDEKEYCYIPCEHILSSDYLEYPIDLDIINHGVNISTSAVGVSTKTTGRKRRQRVKRITYRYEYVPPALYDDDA